YRETGFPVASFRACLDKAGLSPENVDLVVSAEGAAPGSFAVRDHLACAARAAGLGRAPVRRIGTLEACARQAAIGLPSGVVLATDLPRAAGAVVRIDCGRVSAMNPLSGLAAALGLIPRLGAILGLTDREPEDLLQSLELLARSGSHEPSVWFERLEGSLHSDNARAWSDSFDQALERAAGGTRGALADAASPRVEVQHARARIAAGFLDRLAALMVQALEAAAPLSSTDRAVVAGSAFTCPDFNARLGG